MSGSSAKAKAFLSAPIGRSRFLSVLGSTLFAFAYDVVRARGALGDHLAAILLINGGRTVSCVPGESLRSPRQFRRLHSRTESVSRAWLLLVDLQGPDLVQVL